MPPKTNSLAVTNRLAFSIIELIQEELEVNETKYLNVNLHILQEEREEALKVIGEIAERNRIAVKALIYLIANEQRKSEQVLLDHRNRSNGHHE